MSEAETEALQSIKNILRQGRVSAITEQGLTFQTGHSVHMPSQTLYIDCTASAVDRRPAKPVFQAQLITPQMVRTCQPTFSAALIAHIELSVPPTVKMHVVCFFGCSLEADHVCVSYCRMGRISGK